MGDMSFTDITIIAGILVLILVTYKVYVDWKGRRITLHERFLALRDPVGKTLDEIVAAAGLPKYGERLETDIMVYTWSSSSYVIILRFERSYGDPTCTDVLTEEIM